LKVILRVKKKKEALETFLHHIKTGNILRIYYKTEMAVAPRTLPVKHVRAVAGPAVVQIKRSKVLLGGPWQPTEQRQFSHLSDVQCCQLKRVLKNKQKTTTKKNKKTHG